MMEAAPIESARCPFCGSNHIFVNHGKLPVGQIYGAHGYCKNCEACGPFIKLSLPRIGPLVEDSIREDLVAWDRRFEDCGQKLAPFQVRHID